ncbi:MULTISPECIES: glycosyltransferase family 4 protein [Sphingomonadales]|uniref:Glycosyl transferase, group 1 n=1 Tax=Rhizorhabdus wittichii (strain DSM 6014 / CCUG 31198 / JCM 15750 / NBRC 105917 / EY 4224 / RW1) TaxID=392499 RepID=A0A9J9HER9_RHIWR|nr:glycosyl transferase, group 1 [Rhizorhabdus wittichii RW1]
MFIAQHHKQDGAPAAVADRPLRVALFSGNYNCVRDGANQALNRLVAHLIDRGHAVRVYSPTIARPAFPPAGDLVSVPSVPIPTRREYRVALGLPRATRADLDDFAPDIVHLSAPDWLGGAAQAQARRRGIPVVASLHTRFETYLSYYGLGLLRRRADAWLDRFYRHSDMVLVPNAPIADEFAAKGLGDRVRVWGRGVDRAVFSPARRDLGWRRGQGYGDEETVVLFFGRLVLEKGLAIFAQVIAEARARGRRLRPMIVGDGPARGWLAERLPNARFLGHLTGASLGAAIAAADILINPSTTEAFGNVNLEAMAAGVAVVSAEVASATALIADRISGWLVPPVEVGAYVDAIEALIDRPELRASIADAGLAAADAFRWPSILDGVIADYRWLLAG